jgi:hypothetical protein
MGLFKAHFRRASKSHKCNSVLLQLLGVPRDHSYYDEKDLIVDWNAAKERIVKHPAEACQKDFHRQCFPLHIAVRNKSNPPPPNAISAFLEANLDAIDMYTMTLACETYSGHEYADDALSMLLNGLQASKNEFFDLWFFWNQLICGNVDAVRAFIRNLPHVLRAKDETNDMMIAFHKAAICKHPNPEIIRLLMKGGLRHKVGGKFGVGGFMVNDNRGRTPLNLMLLKSSKHDDQNIWQSITQCIETAFASRGESNYFPILHSIMTSSTPSQFDRTTEIVSQYDICLSGRDSSGKTAIIRAIEMDISSTSKKKVIEILVDKTKGCVGCTDTSFENRCFPLHFAAHIGLGWKGGMEDIVHANIDDIDIPDTSTGLFPFQLAAIGLVKDLNVIYNLLRQHPDLSLPTPFTNSFSFLDSNWDDSGSGGIEF